MMKLLCATILLMLSLNVWAQDSSLVSVIIEGDTTISSVNDLVIKIEQKKKILNGSVKNNFFVQKNVPFNIYFENTKPKIPSIYNIKAQSDTIIVIDRTLLETVFIVSKKSTQDLSNFIILHISEILSINQFITISLFSL